MIRERVKSITSTSVSARVYYMRACVTASVCVYVHLFACSTSIVLLSACANISSSVRRFKTLEVIIRLWDTQADRFFVDFQQKKQKQSFCHPPFFSFVELHALALHGGDVVVCGGGAPVLPVRGRREVVPVVFVVVVRGGGVGGMVVLLLVLVLLVLVLR
jgi:hypothetical protein